MKRIEALLEQLNRRPCVVIRALLPPVRSLRPLSPAAWRTALAGIRRAASAQAIGWRTRQAAALRGHHPGWSQ